MSLKEGRLGTADLGSITLKQWKYKFKGYSGFVYALVFVQVFALLISLNPIGTMSSANGNLEVSLQTLSSDMIRVFSFAWIFGIAILLASKHYKNIEFSLVANRLSGNLSNLLLLLTYSVLGGMAATLMSLVQRIIIYYTSGPSLIVIDGFFLSPRDLMLGVGVTGLYMVLVASMGYLLGTLVESNKLMATVIPLGLVGLTRIYPKPFVEILLTFITENDLFLFMLKAVFASALLFGISAVLSNKTEVRK